MYNLVMSKKNIFKTSLILLGIVIVIFIFYFLLLALGITPIYQCFTTMMSDGNVTSSCYWNFSGFISSLTNLFF
jgi:sensor histidine kinase YesM